MKNVSVFIISMNNLRVQPGVAFSLVHRRADCKYIMHIGVSVGIMEQNSYNTARILASVVPWKELYVLKLSGAISVYLILLATDFEEQINLEKLIIQPCNARFVMMLQWRGKF